jgi:hypothetical protein
MLHMYNEFFNLLLNIKKINFLNFIFKNQIYYTLKNYLFCPLIHALSPTLRKCAKFQIDWAGRSVLNIYYKICSRQTDRQTDRQEVKLKRSVVKYAV